MLGSSMRRAPVRGAVSVAAIIGLAALVAGCSTTQESADAAPQSQAGASGSNPVANAIFGQPNPNTKDAIIVSPENFGFTENCPPLSIRAGTETWQVFQPGKKVDPITGETPPIAYQASITKTARDCRKSPTGIAVRVGISGRVVAGPAGKAGNVTVPLRIVVMQGTDKVVKSDLISVAVSLQDPVLSADFVKVDESIDVPISGDANNYEIYVGFDDKAPSRGKAKR